MARSMLQVKRLPNRFWGQAVATAVYLLNISPTRAVMNQTPFEAWRGKKPQVRHLKVFGCVAYALVPSNLRHKLDSKSEKYIFIGYSTESKAYKLYNPVNGKVIVSRDVKFNEEEWWIWSTDEQPPAILSEPEDAEPEQNGSSNSSSPDSTPPGSPTQNSSNHTSPHSSSSSSPASSSTLSPAPNSPSSTSDGTSPKYFRSLCNIYRTCNFLLYVSNPTSFDEAVEHRIWQDVMEVELRPS